MKVFIWNSLDHVSYSYHSNGGLVVVAQSLERAKELCAEKDAAVSIDQDPSLALDVTEDAVEAVFVFPDAGCC